MAGRKSQSRCRKKRRGCIVRPLLWSRVNFWAHRSKVGSLSCPPRRQRCLQKTSCSQTDWRQQHTIPDLTSRGTWRCCGMKSRLSGPASMCLGLNRAKSSFPGCSTNCSLASLTRSISASSSSRSIFAFESCRAFYHHRFPYSARRKLETPSRADDRARRAHSFSTATGS